LWRYLPEAARGGQSWIEWGQQEVRSAEDVHEEQAEGSAPPRPNPAENALSEDSAKAQQAMRRAGIAPRDELILHEDARARSLWWAVRYVVRIPTYVLIVIASGLGYFFFSGVRGFGMIYLTEHYDIGRSLVSALVIVLGAGALVGVIAGGRLSALLLERGHFDARILVPGAALFIAVLFFGPGIWTTNVFFGVGMLALGAMALAAANPPIDAARLDIVPPGLWGRAESGRMALRAALEGTAPILFGAASGWLGGGDKGLERTYLIMLIPLIVAAAVAIPARRTYPRDVATAAASVKASIDAAKASGDEVKASGGARDG
jgi:sugar phosphate permease